MYFAVLFRVTLKDAPYDIGYLQKCFRFSNDERRKNCSVLICSVWIVCLVGLKLFVSFMVYTLLKFSRMLS